MSELSDEGPRSEGELRAKAELVAPVADQEDEEGILADEANFEGEGEEDTVENVHAEEDPEDVEPLRHAPTPQLPPDSVQKEHNTTHIPYRSWCRWCVEGRGLGEQRGAHKGRRHGIAIVGVDYWFITEGGMKKRKEIIKDYPEDADGATKLQEDRKSGKIVQCLII